MVAIAILCRLKPEPRPADRRACRWRERLPALIGIVDISLC